MSLPDFLEHPKIRLFLADSLKAGFLETGDLVLLRGEEPERPEAPGSAVHGAANAPARGTGDGALGVL